MIVFPSDSRLHLLVFSSPPVGGRFDPLSFRPAVAVHGSECELSGSGGPPLHSAAFRRRLQPSVGGGVPAAPRGRRARQGQRVRRPFESVGVLVKRRVVK